MWIPRLLFRFVMWIFGRNGASGFSARSTAEDVTRGIDGTGLTAIVTGASSGIGLETARVLALRGVHVVIAVRNVTAGEVVKETILKDIPAANINIMELDLSSMASVRRFASEYISSGLPLNLLINNAGIMATPFALSHDNIELQFATNHLGHFLLTNLLLETLKKTSLERNLEGRIVNVASLGHRLALTSSFDHNEINDKSRYNKVFAYFMTKLANILHSNELSRQLKEEGVKVMVNSLHPGIIVTNICRHNLISNAVAKIGSFLVKNIQQGAATTCYVALHPQLKGVSGLYFSNCNVANTSDKAGDMKLAKELWDLSISFTK